MSVRGMDTEQNANLLAFAPALSRAHHDLPISRVHAFGGVACSQDGILPISRHRRPTEALAWVM